MAMPDFTLYLPPEIVSVILSHVNQADCIECMTVCRRWYKLIPQYGKDVWKELKISRWSWPRFNKAMLECLGTHVEKVSVIDWKNTNKILQQLERRECSIESLEIEAIFNYYIYGLDRATVSDGIGLFRKTLKELFINGHCIQYVSLKILLNLLPSLTHLTIKLTHLQGESPFEGSQSLNEKIQRNMQLEDDNNNDMYNLVFLSLDSEPPRNLHSEQILKRCPRLKYLLVSIGVLKEYDELSHLDFTSLLEICPSIHYAHWGNYSVPEKVEKEWLTLSRRARGCVNTENTSNYEKRGANHLRQVEFSSDIEQEHISTLKVCLQQPSLLEHLRLTGTFNTSLCRVWNSLTHRNSNSSSQWPQLKSLELVSFRVPHQIENNMFFENLFSHFKHLERLEMNFYVRPVDNVDEEQNSISKMYKAIGHQLHQLTYLCIDLSYLCDCEITVVLYRYIFTSLCKWNQKLEILRLRSVTILDDMLLDLCRHPKLHTLRLEVSGFHEQLTQDGWISFGRKLKEQEQMGYSGGKIETLYLSWGYSDGITDEVLEEFAGIESLKTLTIGHNSKITDAGINTFLNVDAASGKSVKKLQLHNCSVMASDNPRVVFDNPRYD